MRTLVLAVVLSGCGVGISFTTDRSQYELSDAQVRLTMSNGREKALGWNSCFVMLERESSGAWIGVASSRICNASLPMIGAWGAMSSVERLDPALPSGTYRFFTTVETCTSCGMTELRTEPFTVH